MQLQRKMTAIQQSEVEVLTVDKCQGRDKPVILLSLVRSNSEKVAGSLLADWRRINVALTRAQKKFVIIGSSSTLASIPLLANLIDICRERQWLIPVPEV